MCSMSEELEAKFSGGSDDSKFCTVLYTHTPCAPFDLGAPRRSSSLVDNGARMIHSLDSSRDEPH